MQQTSILPSIPILHRSKEHSDVRQKNSCENLLPWQSSIGVQPISADLSTLSIMKSELPYVYYLKKPVYPGQLSIKRT